MKMINEFIHNKRGEAVQAEGHLKDFVYKDNLRKNVPYYEWSLENSFADATQIFKTY